MPASKKPSKPPPLDLTGVKREATQAGATEDEICEYCCDGNIEEAREIIQLNAMLALGRKPLASFEEEFISYLKEQLCIAEKQSNEEEVAILTQQLAMICPDQADSTKLTTAPKSIEFCQAYREQSTGNSSLESSGSAPAYTRSVLSSSK